MLEVAEASDIWSFQRSAHDWHRYNHVAGIGINGDRLPRPENRLELSAESTRPVYQNPSLTYFSYGESERWMSTHAENLMTAAWKG